MGELRSVFLRDFPEDAVQWLKHRPSQSEKQQQFDEHKSDYVRQLIPDPSTLLPAWDAWVKKCALWPASVTPRQQLAKVTTSFV